MRFEIDELIDRLDRANMALDRALPYTPVDFSTLSSCKEDDSIEYGLQLLGHRITRLEGLAERATAMRVVADSRPSGMMQDILGTQ